MNDSLLDFEVIGTGEIPSTTTALTTDPAFPYFPEFFDSSMVASYKSCATLFNLTYLQQWKSKEPSVHLHAGGAFARGIEIARRSFYEEGLSPEDSVAAGLKALIAFYGTFQCPADSAKSLERMCGALEFYFSHYPLDESTPPIILPGGRKAIEFSFAHPLPINHPITGNPLLYVGRMDAILNWSGGAWITDEKTTTQLGASWSRQWDLRAQFSGYAWGCQQSGIHIDGALVRGVSILKTKYDTQEVPTYRPEWQVERWYEELLEWIEEAIRDWKRWKFKHNLDHTCAEYGGCAFRQICTVKGSESFLETYFQRRMWNPLTRQETVL